MKPLLPALILVLGASPIRSQDPEPINLFRPEAGQRTALYLTLPDGQVIDTMDYRITRRAGDTAFFLKDEQGEERDLVWSQGKLRGRGLLASGTLDTNGIFRNQKSFPADFSNASGSPNFGYTLQHVVQGYVFDTLLVSCYYGAGHDVGDNCDFITPSGHFVYSNVRDCFCLVPRYQRVPDSRTLAAMGGRPVRTRVLRPALAKTVASLHYPAAFDLQGRRMDGGKNAFSRKRHTSSRP